MSSPPRSSLPDIGVPALEALLDRTQALVYTVDANERILSINRAMRQRIDYDPATLGDIRALARSLYPEPTVREVVLTAHRNALAGAVTRDAEWVFTSRQGDLRQVRWQFALIGSGEGRILVLTGEDVTDRRKLEQWVRLQNSLLEKIPEAVVVSDLDGRILHWTGAAESMFGYAPRAALERPLSNLFPGENARAAVLEVIAALKQDGKADWSRPLRREDGETIECRIQGARVHNERGIAVALSFVITPATIEVEPLPVDTEEPALEKAFAQVAVVGTVVAGPDGVVRTWGRGVERIGGMGSAKAVGRVLFDDVLQSPGLTWETVSSRLTGRGRFQAKAVISRPNGTSLPVDLEVHAVRAAGELVSVIAVVEDRSELQTLTEEALATKTQALDGIFATGVVARLVDTCTWFEPDHRTILNRLADLRTVARMVTAGTTLREFEAFTRRIDFSSLDRDLDDWMYRLGEGVHRLRSLVDDIARFEAGEADPPGPARLSRELESARDLIAHHFENRITVEYVFDDLPAVRAARRPLLRGLVLLLLASAAACEGAERPTVVIEGKHQAGWVNLDIRDNGAGYSVDVQSRLADLPYLASQHGYAPLYLGMAREALRLAGGNLEIGTAAGTGARVKVSFPAADAAVAVQAFDLPRPSGPTRGRVLLVEEDELLRHSAVRYLGEIHEVVAHPTIADAIPTLSATPYDAAVVGLPRPESFGLRLLNRLAESAPTLVRNTVVLIPPGTKQGTRERLVLQGWVVLARPVDFTTLRTVLLRLIPAEELPIGE